MITIEEIEKLTEYQKDVFMTKDDFKEIRESLDSVQTSLDNISKNTQTLIQDDLVLNKRVKNTEEWIDKASPKLGLEFKH